MMIQVKSQSPFINPMEFNSLPIRAFVIEVNSEVLVVQSDFGTKYIGTSCTRYSQGEEGRIRLFGAGFGFESLSEAQAERLLAEQRHEERRLQAKLEDEEWRARNRAYNESIKLPFDWLPVQFIRVAMLHERGMGSGRARNNVVHILTLEDFAAGRLKRKRGDVLCGKTAKFEDDFSFHGEEVCRKSSDRNKVSCPGCVARAQKLMTKPVAF